MYNICNEFSVVVFLVVTFGESADIVGVKSFSSFDFFRNDMTEHEEFVGNLKTVTNLLTWTLGLLSDHLKKVIST